MYKLRAVLTAFLLVSILALAFPSGVLAVPPGDPGDCGVGYQFIARYNWDDTLGYVFDSGWDVVTFSLYNGVLDDRQGSWDSGSIVIDEVVFKDGNVVPNVHIEIPPPGATSGYFDASEWPEWNPDTQAHEISHIDFCAKTTLISLDSFTASAGHGRVTLSWKTGAEVDNAGFNLHRSRFADGTRGKVNSLLIAPKGDISGASYIETDAPGYGLFYYWLEDVDTSGHRSIHGPVQVLVLPTLRRPAYRPSLPTQ